MPDTDAAPPVPDQVEVRPPAQDEEIASRLEDILQSTGWFSSINVSVQDGVVFLEGSTDESDYKDWAGELAGKTEGVVAVVNRILVVQAAWDFTSVLDEMARLLRGFVLAIPRLLFGGLIVATTILLAILVSRSARRLLLHSIASPLLRDVAAWLIAAPVIIIGIYVVLQFFGLTRLALTVLGGTGLFGLVVGIAFSDIVENFLASILISVRTPFQAGDVIKISEHLGIVQRVTTRGTLLMGLDGNHIQIPNATIYKHTIINYTANPNRRIDFLVGIDYEDAIAPAQDLIMRQVSQHPAVLQRPEPLVLAENLGASTVDLRVYFWIDGNRYDQYKVKSSVIRLTKIALLREGFTLPDAAREVVFPRGVPIISPQATAAVDADLARRTDASEILQPVESVAISTPAEDQLGSDDEKIREQARSARIPEEGRDLLS
ncbi:MAG: mechanosensitive ion channel family protein [Caldilineales bacterium]